MSAVAVAGWRGKLIGWIESPPIQHFLISVIVLNAVVLGLETSPALMGRWGPALVAADRAMLAVFVVEIGLRIVAHRRAFFRDPWSVFDFLVTAVALVPAAGPFSVLRALRVLRVLRLLTMVPSMRRVVGGLLSAIPGLASVVAIIGIIFYVSAVIATKLFAERFPDWFGSLGDSAYTLFQVMTLESWSMGIARPVMDAYPYAWIFFVAFILVSTFTMLNLFIAIIVNAMQSQQSEEARHTEQVVAERIDDDTAALQRELAAMRLELREVRDLLRARQKG
jgi:voltage-gated sodium channel